MLIRPGTSGVSTHLLCTVQSATPSPDLERGSGAVKITTSLCVSFVKLALYKLVCACVCVFIRQLTVWSLTDAPLISGEIRSTTEEEEEGKDGVSEDAPRLSPLLPSQAHTLQHYELTKE